MAYVGCLEESIENSLIDMKEIKRIAGTSAGAIIAVLLGLGYELTEIKHMLGEMGPESLLDFRDWIESKIKR